jgi:(2R)-ethylmalonyl-CoA mutase
VFGEYRAPTGLGSGGPVGHRFEDAGADSPLARVRTRVRETAAELGAGRLRMLVGKPGLDGHSNGAEQIAVRARDVGFEVVYQGIRLTPAQIVAAAVAEDVDLVGLSVLSGSHLDAVPAVLDGLREAGRPDLPVVVGGIIPDHDAATLRKAGVARVFTPRDFAINVIMDELVTVVREANGLS